MMKPRLRHLALFALPLASIALTLTPGQDKPKVEIPKDPGPAANAAPEISANAPIELRRMQEELGTWQAEIHSYMAAGMRPQVTSGVEVNRMVGDAWMVTDFEGITFGQPYQGHGQTSFDLESKRAVGTWIDTLAPQLQILDGTYDLRRRERVFEFEAAGPDEETTHTMRWTKRVIDAEHRVFHITSISEDGEEVPLLKILYTLQER